MVTTALYEKKVTFKQLVSNWAAAYLGNLVGSLAMVSMVQATGILVNNALPAALAAAKMSLSWETAFMRGVLCNV